jgi:hypothetical protein
MDKPKFSLATYKDPNSVELVKSTDQKVLAHWAIDCTNRVLHFFIEEYPDDKRPANALRTLQHWIETGEFSMSVIRKASLDSHAAAKEIGNDSPAASAAHCAGQAVAIAHVPLHALGAANYALQAVYRNSKPHVVAANLLKERQWQMRHLQTLSQT